MSEHDAGIEIESRAAAAASARELASAARDAAIAPARRRAGRLALLRRAGYAPDLRMLGRTLMHAALVGLAAGAIGALFLGLLDGLELVLLEGLCGYRPLRAAGEPLHGAIESAAFRPWLLMFLPALGGLVCGWLARRTPEVSGGGGSAMIAAYHQRGGRVRARVVPLKLLSSIATLGTGGSGGREGPTLQIGGALGSIVADQLHVDPRERRLLVVAGVAAGIAAVFRTPLGAALLAVEILYRDDFEADALVPAVLASVVAFAVTTPLYGQSALFAHAASYPFVPSQLGWFLLLALAVSGAAALFVGVMRWMHRLVHELPGPTWLRPAWGGIALGLCAVPAIVYFGRRIGIEGQGLGILGGGYGAAQLAITGSDLLPSGWGAVEILLLLALAKMLATAFTIGSGGSAGDFAPSLVLGGLIGGAFGHALRALTGNAAIDPGAFALVGMGTFYAGIAHVPLSALVLVSELAGSYDLLVPLMLGVGVSFVVLRKLSLYEAQPANRAEVGAGSSDPLQALDGLRLAQLEPLGQPPLAFARAEPLRTVLARAAEAEDQELFPVVDAKGELCGAITAQGLRFAAGRPELLEFATADDLAAPVARCAADRTLRAMAEVLLSSGQQALVVVDAAGRPLRILSEADLFEAQLAAQPARTARSTRG